MLTRITQFHGLSVEASGEEPFEEETEAKPSMLARLNAPPQGKMAPPARPKQDMQLEKLYISDDDIQDD